MRKRQGILVILDGLGDRPNKELNGKTPLEYADTPNMDKMAQEGMCGNVYPISPGIRVGTDVGHLEIFGCNSREVYPGRGPLEAASAGLDLRDGDIAFRGNFATLDEGGKVVDRRAGRINANTKELAEALSGMVLRDGTQVLVKELTEHRVAVVLRGDGLSDKITCTDVGTAMEGGRIIVPRAEDEQDEASVKTARNLWEFTGKCHELLKNHPVNLERMKNGSLPANTILTRGVGKMGHIPNIAEKFGIKAACIAGDQTVGGIAKLVGYEYHTEASFTGGFETDMMGKGRKAIELLHQGYDWVIIHIKATDLAGHDNLPKKKARLIEQIDGMIGYIRERIDRDKCYLALTGDHSTPCEARDHTGDGVPSIISGGDVRKDSITSAGETQFMSGSLNNLTASDFFMLQMDLLGFTEKLGA